MFPSHMNIQGRLGGEISLTNKTMKRRQSQMAVHMLLEVDLLSELPVTLVT